MAPAEVFGVYVVWCEGRSDVCENQSGEVRIQGVGEFGSVPPLV